MKKRETETERERERERERGDWSQVAASNKRERRVMEEDDNFAAHEKPLADQADAKVLEKLSKGDAERAALREKRKEEEAAKADPRENVNNFNASQQREAEAIESCLEELVKHPPTTKDEIHEAKSTFESLRLRVLDIEKTAANASYFLSAYDVRATSDLAKNLKTKIDGIQKKVLPRKAFSFSRRKVMKERNLNSNNSNKSVAQAGNDSQSLKQAEASSVQVATKGMKVELKENQVISITQEDATSDDIEICNATDCTFYLVTKLAVLRLVNLNNCKVFCGPVDGSLYLEGAKDSVVMAAAHQVRIHKSFQVDFYLRSRSYPIIEKCSDVHFAPYSFKYEGLDEHLVNAKLEEENDLWSDVKDFGWLKSTPSPNWSILPVEKRVTEVMK